jgi:hypothetical protein
MKRFLILFSLFIGVLLISCDDKPDLADSGILSFSKDTLTFDTVFTTIGSATARILVYNKDAKPVTIDNLRLAGGRESSFRINVDGSTNEDHSFGPLTLRGKDSMYVFVEVKVDPLEQNSPVLIRDSLVLSSSEGNAKMVLEAFGQDMEVLRSVSVMSDTVLDSTLPYLVYGDLVVDSAATLRLAPGTRLYFHHNSNLMVFGNLKAEGTQEQPVLLRGDRMDRIGFVTPVPYNLVAGQWGGVYLMNPQGNHLLSHVNISSGYVGVYYINQDKQHKPFLEIRNSRIHNFLFYNLVAINGDMVVSNSAITNSGGYTVYLNGGKHDFYHCTIANYFSNSSAQSVSRDKAPAFMMMALARSFPMETNIVNSVIAGSAQNELSIASRFSELYKASVTSSYVKRTKALELPQFSRIRWSAPNDTVFASTREDLEDELYFNFLPDSVSPVRGLADPEIAQRYPTDLRGRSRLADGAPDAGAYEWAD